MSKDDAYFPPDVVLRMIANGDVPIGVEGPPKENLNQLIKLTSDSNPSNRDWAVFLLSHANVDTEKVRQTLMSAFQDTCADVRAEALVGLAMRDPKIAMPLVQHELHGPFSSQPLFDAASYIGDPILCDAIETALRRLDEDTDCHIYSAGIEALNACRNSAPADPIFNADD